MKTIKDNLSFHSWIATRILPTLMKTDEMSTTRSICLYKFKLDPADTTSSIRRIWPSLFGNLSVPAPGSGDKARGANVMVLNIQ